MVIVAVIVSYSSDDQLASIVRLYRAHGIRVVVVENGHPSQEVCQDADIFLCGHGNIGYGAAVNYGYRVARDRFGAIDWILVANADASPSGRLLRAVTEDELGETGDLFGFHESNGERWRAVVPSPTSPFMIMLRGEKRVAANLRDSKLYPVGALLLIRSRSFDQLGGFDPHLFLYFEEVDLVWRARQLGQRVVFAPHDLTYKHASHSATKGVAIAAAYELGRSGATYVGIRKRPILSFWIIGEFLRLLALDLRARIHGDKAIKLRICATRRGFFEGLVRPRLAETRSRQLLDRPAAAKLANNILTRPHATQEGLKKPATLVLFEDPRSLRAGVNLRNWSTLTSLTVDFEVTCVVGSGRLVGAESDGGVRYVAGAKRGIVGTSINAFATRRQWMTARYDTSRTRREILSAAGISDLVVVSMINMGTILESQLHRLKVQPAMVWDTHNFDPELWSLEARDSRGLRRILTMRESRHATAAAASLAPRMDAVIACTQRDLEMWEALLGNDCHLYLAPNGADLASWGPIASASPTKGVFASFGSLGQRMTADGLVDFLERSWPGLKHTRAESSLLIVGRNPRKDLIEAAAGAVDVTIIADPDDLPASVCSAELFLFPQIRGYGSKIKMYEALATGRPIVASGAAVVGIPDQFLRRVTIVVNNEWAAAVELALQNPGDPEDVLSAADTRKLGWQEQQDIMRRIYSGLVVRDLNSSLVGQKPRRGISALDDRVLSKEER